MCVQDNGGKRVCQSMDDPYFRKNIAASDVIAMGVAKGSSNPVVLFSAGSNHFMFQDMW